MFCRNCGKEIPDGSHNCMYCGSSLNDDNNAEKTTVVNTTEGNSNESEITATESLSNENSVKEVEVKAEDVEVKSDDKKEDAIEENKEENKAEDDEPEKAKDEKIEDTNTEAVSPQAMAAPVPQPSPVIQPMANTVDNQVEQKASKKKGGAAVAIVIIVIILLLAGIGAGAFFYLNSPEQKIKKAANNGEVATVCELYGDVKNDDVKSYVQDVMYNYACELESQYKAEEIDYKTAKKDLDELGKSVLKGDKDFKSLTDDMAALDTSRTNFKNAEKDFKNEDYEAAYEKYSLVIKDDSNYKTAQKKMAECEELMVPPITGIWKYEYDLGDAILAELDADGMGYNIKCPITICIEFNDDGTGKFFVDEDSLTDGLESAMSDIVDIMYDMLEQETGMSRTEIDEYLYDYSGLTLTEMLFDDLDPDELFDSSQLYNDFDYEVDDSAIYIDNCEVGTGELSYYMEGDCLVITGDTVGIFDGTEEFGLILPVYFQQ